MQLGKYQNVADFIIKMAQAPSAVRFNLTIEELKQKYDLSIAPKISRQMEVYEKRYDGFQARFSMIQADRSVGICKQFTELFKRNLQYLLRNPATIRMTFVNASFIALLVLALFWQVGNVDLTNDIEGRLTRQSLFNWVGLSFMLTNNIMMPSVQNVVLQMPL